MQMCKDDYLNPRSHEGIFFIVQPSSAIEKEQWKEIANLVRTAYHEYHDAGLHINASHIYEDMLQHQATGGEWVFYRENDQLLACALFYYA